MLPANEVPWYINNQIEACGCVNCPPIDLHLNLTHADHPAEWPRKIFSLAQFCSTSRWISLFYFCAGLTGEWIMLTAPVWNIECKLWFCVFLDGGGDVPAAFFSPDVGPRNELWLAGSQQRCLRGGKRERILSVPLQSLQITRRWAFLHALLLMY